MKIIAGRSNKELVANICDDLHIEPCDATINTFSDGEINVSINEHVRGEDVYVVQSMCYPVNDNLVELCLILDALKRSSCKRVTAVIPYYGYGRQDRKIKSKVPISAKVVADMLTVCGVDRVLTVDMHAGQIQGFFNCPVDNLYASSVFLPLYQDKDNLTIVSPDAGGVDRANAYAKRLNCPLATVYKHRDKPNSISEMQLIGSVEGKDCLVLDDMVDTAGTICKASGILKDKGAKKVEVFATHGVLSNNAIEKIEKSDIDKLYITNTIPLKTESSKIEVVRLERLLAKAILNIFLSRSTSHLFENNE
jgi:ribose-phosphate pyrophosphokinase